jgi:SAM-dependent methyltransferase
MKGAQVSRRRRVVRDLTRKAMNALPVQPKVDARLRDLVVLRSSLRDSQIACAQLQDVIREMGGLIPPPAHLQVRVSGTYSPDFIEHGRILLGYLRAALSRVDRDLTTFDTVLDFGCGCARLLRALHYQATPSQRLYGTDIDSESIEWCRANYATAAEFSINPPMPPMDYADNMFDLVYSVSVFTHLPEDMQFAWLQELQRITRPGGYLLLTTHGEKHFEDVPEEFRMDARRKGFHYRHRRGTEGLPNFYQVAYHTPHYIRAQWTQYVDVLDIVERAVDNHQDIVLCRKR